MVASTSKNGSWTASTSRRAYPPKELQNLLAWAEAERPDVALIAASNFLSNPAKEYLEAYRRNNRPGFKIRHWEKPQLVRMLRGKVSLQRKYNLTSIPIKSTQDILHAEEEFFTKVWYGRKQSAATYRVQRTPEHIIKGMLKAKRDAEKRYGKKNLGPWDDFEWECLAGSSLPSVGWLEMNGTCSIRETRVGWGERFLRTLTSSP